MIYLNMYYTFCTKAGHFCTWFHLYLIIYLTPQVLILMTIIQVSRGSFSGRCTSLGMFCDRNDGVWIIDHRNCLSRQFSSPLYPIYHCPLSSFAYFSLPSDVPCSSGFCLHIIHTWCIEYYTRTHYKFLELHWFYFSLRNILLALNKTNQFDKKWI